METVHSIVRKTYDRDPTDDLNGLDVNTDICGIFMSVTLQAAVRLGRDCAEKLRFIKNHLWKSVKQLFKEPDKLIKNQTEISGLTAIDYKEHTWSATSLLCDEAYQITNVETYVFADSKVCLGSMRDEPIEAWKNKI